MRRGLCLFALALGFSLFACRSSQESGGADAGNASSGDPNTPKSVLEADLTGDVTEHLSISGGSQVGRIEAGFIRFTLSQSNDVPEGAPARRTFSLQSGETPTLGQPFGAQGHLVYNGEAFHTTQCKVTIASDTAGKGPHARWLEGSFHCAGLHREARNVEADGHFSAPFVDSTRP